MMKFAEMKTDFFCHHESHLSQLLRFKLCKLNREENFDINIENSEEKESEWASRTPRKQNLITNSGKPHQGIIGTNKCLIRLV